MKSIRLSLLVYLLVLLSAALGAIGSLTYSTAQQTLRDKEESTRTLLLEQHESRARDVRDDRDDRILRRAQQLATVVQSQFGSGRYHELYALGFLSAAGQPQAHITVPLWLAESEARVFHRLRWLSTTRIHFADAVVETAEDHGHCPEYFQIFSEIGKPLQHSTNLSEGALTLDPALRSRLSLFECSFDDTHLSERTVRRVTLKAPVARYRLSMPTPYVAPTPPLKPATTNPVIARPRTPAVYVPPTTAGSPSVMDRTMPSIFIQCAFDVEQRDAALAQLDDDLQAALTNLEEETQARLADMRRRLLIIGLATFVASLVGGFWLVWLGLSPLHRLSEAVSRVSPQDFRLNVEHALLPTELRPIAGRLAQTLESLERAFSREKQAAADISHELRTPLAALLATIDIALRRSRSVDEYRELLLECQASGQHMNRLVERLLTLARIDAGVDLSCPELVDAADLTRECAGLVQHLAESRGLTLNLQDGPPLLVHADPRKLRDVINNLLHNAVEYNRPNGAVDVTCTRHNGSVRIEVRDTGIGLAPQDRTRVFERFYRADPSRQADGLHAGLGLAISKSYIELMGGSIEVDSEVGVGSRFKVDLPACPIPPDDPVVAVLGAASK